MAEGSLFIPILRRGSLNEGAQSGHGFRVLLLGFFPALFRAGLHEAKAPQNQHGADDHPGEGDDDLPYADPQGLSRGGVLRSYRSVLRRYRSMLRGQGCGLKLGHVAVSVAVPGNAG